MLEVKEDKTESLMIRLSKSESKILREMATKFNLSKSEILRTGLRFIFASTIEKEINK